MLNSVRFNWLRFCEKHNVEFVTAGPNTKRGEISIRCPFCGASDPSQHLGLSLNVASPSWGCLRDGRHRGRNPSRLIQKLLNCTQQHADQLVSMGSAYVDDFDTALEKLRGGEQQEQGIAVITEVKMPSEFHPLWISTSVGRDPYLDYLESRGFSPATKTAASFALYFARVGDYKQRIIIPVFGSEEEIVGWTSRTIRSDVSLRYKANPELPRDVLFNEDVARSQVEEGDVLVLTEGPMDAMKIAMYGEGCAAVALLGVAVSKEKFSRVVKIAAAARAVICLLDQDILSSNLRLMSQLEEVVRGGRVKIGRLPIGVKDPGDLSQSQVQELTREWSHI